MINCMSWCIDCDPGGIFYLMPTEDTASKIVSGKLRPTIEKSPRLARYLSARQDDTTLARIRLSHGVTIWPAHANSASSMATWTAKHCFGDEVDKYPATVGKESDPITLLNGGGVVDHGGSGTGALLDAPHERIAEQPKSSSVAERHGVIAVSANPAFGVLEQGIEFGSGRDGEAAGERRGCEDKEDGCKCNSEHDTPLILPCAPRLLRPRGVRAEGQAAARV